MPSEEVDGKQNKSYYSKNEREKGTEVTRKDGWQPVLHGCNGR